MKEAARLLRLIPGGGTGGIMWKLLMMAQKLNRTGSVARSSLASSIECRKIIMQKKRPPHTSLDFNANQGGEARWAFRGCGPLSQRLISHYIPVNVRANVMEIL